MRAVLARHEAARVCTPTHARKAGAMDTKVGRMPLNFDMPKKDCDLDGRNLVFSTLCLAVMIAEGSTHHLG